MLSYFQISSIFTKIGATAGFLSNTLLIYLTVFHVKKVFGTYKIMITVFAILEILFSACELFAKPFIHNYDMALIYFSLGEGVPEQYLRFGLAMFSGLYQVILALIALLFLYRYLALFDSKLVKKFDGNGIFMWIAYPLLHGIVYTSSFYIYSPSDSYADEYVKEEILNNYEMAIGEVPRFIIMSYNADGSIRLSSTWFLIQGTIIISINYVMIIILGLKMSFGMQEKLKDHSATYRRLQKQFFRALVVQTLAPTLLFVLPAGPVLLGPLLSPWLGIQIRLRTGWLCTVFGFFPPIDSIAFMVIVSEYRKIVRDHLKNVLLPFTSFSTVSQTSVNKAHQVKTST